MIHYNLCYLKFPSIFQIETSNIVEFVTSIVFDYNNSARLKSDRLFIKIQVYNTKKELLNTGIFCFTTLNTKLSNEKDKMGPYSKTLFLKKKM